MVYFGAFLNRARGGTRWWGYGHQMDAATDTERRTWGISDLPTLCIYRGSRAIFKIQLLGQFLST